MKNILLMLFATAALWAAPGLAQQVTVVDLKTKGATTLSADELRKQSDRQIASTP